MKSLNMSKQLQSLLDEVGFVYRTLPGALQRVEAVTPTKGWRTFFHRQAKMLREQQQFLVTTVADWGHHLHPCVCLQVTERMNEVRYALAARPGTPVLERLVHGVLADLRTLVISHLADAAKLAVRIGEDGLSTKLLDLLDQERKLAQAGKEVKV